MHATRRFILLASASSLAACATAPRDVAIAPPSPQSEPAVAAVAEPAPGEAIVPAAVRNGANLVATGRGTMAHRPECVVVAGKPDVRAVSAAEWNPHASHASDHDSPHKSSLSDQS